MARGLTIWSIAAGIIFSSVALAQPVTPAAPTELPPAPRGNAVPLPVLQPDKAGPAAPPGEQDKLAAIGEKLEALAKNLTVVTADEQIKLVLGGILSADFFYNQARPV